MNYFAMNYIKHLKSYSAQFLVLVSVLLVFVVHIDSSAIAKKSPSKQNTVKKTPAKKSVTARKPIKQKQVAATTTSKKKVQSGSAKGQVRSKKRGVPKAPVIETITDTIIDDGIRYRHFLYGRRKHSVHVAEMTATNQTLKVGLIKALERIDGLERLGDMSIRNDSTSRDTLLIGINANFWKAYRNTPIGPMVSGGEVVHLHSYKQWSSAFFDSRNRMTIDRFVLNGRVRVNNRSMTVAHVNERLDSTGIVVYNSFGGNSIPFVSPIDLEKAAQEFLQNHSMVTEDSTEIGLNMETLRQEIANAKREASIEYPMRKVVVRYLKNPAINREVPCLVTAVDSGVVQMPIRGCIISFGKDVPQSSIPQNGETIFVKFSTNMADSTQFMTAVSGTPRIVRYGIAKHEAMIEGSHARRFLNQNLARTGIGTDKSRSKNYFVIVEANNEKGKGATLTQMAGIMKAVGCWNAINLDGGGSAMMVVCGANACTNSTVPSGRKISAALGVFRRPRMLKPNEKER